MANVVVRVVSHVTLRVTSLAGVKHLVSVNLPVTFAFIGMLPLQNFSKCLILHTSIDA
jgi:hypothetical protein